jgi:hypothetical protein
MVCTYHMYNVENVKNQPSANIYIFHTFKKGTNFYFSVFAHLVNRHFITLRVHAKKEELFIFLFF